MISSQTSPLSSIQSTVTSVRCVQTPSPEDIDVTNRLYEAGKIVGVDLLDHVIIGDHQFISMKEKGYF